MDPLLFFWYSHYAYIGTINGVLFFSGAAFQFFAICLYFSIFVSLKLSSNSLILLSVYIFYQTLYFSHYCTFLIPKFLSGYLKSLSLYWYYLLDETVIVALFK